MLFAIFLIAELRQERPMLDLSLFKKPAFTGASLVALAISSSMFSMFLYLTLYIQDVLGYDPLQAGLRFLPITLISFFVAPISGKLSVSVPIRLLIGCGLLLVSGGLLSMTAIDASSGWTTLIPGFLLAGAGIGMINPPLASTAVGVVHHSRSGMASGINNTFRQVGIATGVAGLGAVFQHEIATKTTRALATQRPARTSSRLGAGGSPGARLRRRAPDRRTAPGPGARRADPRLPRRLHRRAHLDPADRLGHRAARRDRRVRPDPQPRLRRLRTSRAPRARRSRRPVARPDGCTFV